MVPIDITSWSLVAQWMLSFGIGLAFGAVLESAGFGDSRRLSAQFYLRDMTVLKVMFGGIITAATLIFLTSSLGWLDFPSVFVNHTYLASQVVGGLIMGVGFIVGGFCPGTSLVAASTLKIDGVVFLMGVAAGLFAFGETVPAFEAFYESGNQGRFTIGDWLAIDNGWALVGVVALALAMFYGGEIAEAMVGRGQAWSDVSLVPRNRWKNAAAATVVGLALFTAWRGQPDAADRWQVVAPQAQVQLTERAVYAHPLEIVQLKQNPGLYVHVLDVRPEHSFNLFHLKGAWHTPLETFDDPAFYRQLVGLPPNTVLIVMGQAEQEATAAWKRLQAERVPNAYIAEGGYNAWWALFPPESCLAESLPGADPVVERATWRFTSAIGARSYAAHPDCGCVEQDITCGDEAHASGRGEHPGLPAALFTPKVKVKTGPTRTGGCS